MVAVDLHCAGGGEKLGKGMGIDYRVQRRQSLQTESDAASWWREDSGTVGYRRRSVGGRGAHLTQRREDRHSALCAWSVTPLWHHHQLAAWGAWADGPLERILVSSRQTSMTGTSQALAWRTGGAKEECRASFTVNKPHGSVHGLQTNWQTGVPLQSINVYLPRRGCNNTWDLNVNKYLLRT